MKKYLTPDFDVTVYEVADKITAEVSTFSFVDSEETTAGGNTDWGDF